MAVTPATTPKVDRFGAVPIYTDEAINNVKPIPNAHILQ
jgi:hypothetical protein